jgi:ribulose-5-phosphate 4-epimerase/fuculose-1-phosphate aldolase
MAKKTKTKTATKTNTKSLAALKDEICDIGRRIYNKGFAAGNDGNISYRLGPNKVLCTPTMMSKGFMTPADLCIVDNADTRDDSYTYTGTAYAASASTGAHPMAQGQQRFTAAEVVAWHV